MGQGTGPEAGKLDNGVLAFPSPKPKDPPEDASQSLLAASGKFFIERLAIPDVIVIRPKNLFIDRRGLFCETYRYGDFAKAAGTGLMPAQVSFSISAPFVLRGLHYQIKNPQGKFIQIAQGKIFDVAVDLRRGSPTFGKWCGVALDASQPAAVYIPPRFAHGFMTFQEGATVFYLCTSYHDPESDRVIRWDDPAIGIQWPLGHGAVLTMSAKDRSAPGLAEAEVFP